MSKRPKLEVWTEISRRHVGGSVVYDKGEGRFAQPYFALTYEVRERLEGSKQLRHRMVTGDPLRLDEALPAARSMIKAFIQLAEGLTYEVLHRDNHKYGGVIETEVREAADGTP